MIPARAAGEPGGGRSSGRGAGTAQTAPGARPNPGTGRPRSRGADAAILGAALRILATAGYQGLTIEGVAAAAGVGRPTVYRRYASKADLVAAALASLAPDEPALPPDTREALLALLRATSTALGERGGMTLVGSLLAQEDRDPDLVALFRTRVFAPRHAVVRGVLERGVAGGAVRATADLDVAIDLLFGALLARAAAGERADEAYLASVVDGVLGGIAAQGTIA